MEDVNLYTRTALIAVLVNNDFHYIHLLSAGADFDKSHNLAQSYYEMIEPEIDYLMELALENGAPIYNYSIARDIIHDYVPEDKPSYDYQSVINCLKTKIAIYLDALKKLRDYTDNSIQSYLDDLIRGWEKELNYKLARRTEKYSLNSFVKTGLDARILAFYATKNS